MKNALSQVEVSKITAKDVHDVLGKRILADGYGFVCDLQKSHDLYLYDSKGENFYLDFFSFFASLPIGFNHPKLTTPAFIEKLGKLAVIKPSLSDIYTVELAQFVETFARVAAPEGFPHFFFISGGALAVENALKVAFDWKFRKNMAAGKSGLGNKVIHFVRAFHGRTGYTLSITNSPDPRKTNYFPKFDDWSRITNPKVTFPLEDNLDSVLELEKLAKHEIEAAIKRYGDDIAAIIIEPIQGEGGDNHFRTEFFQYLRKIADDHEIILIFDEVQSGMGLTGKFWAYENYGVAPDIISFGKKSQVCGILASTRIDEVENNCFAESSRINSTWGGNLIDMVRAQRILEIIEEDNLVENARVMGEYLINNLYEIQKENPNIISNIRGKGLMCAFDLACAKKRDKLVDKLFEKKLIILACGDNSIRFRPSLNVTQEHIDKAMSLIREAIMEL